MSSASIAFTGWHPEPYNPNREVFLMNIRLTELETHVNSTFHHLATKEDLKDVEGRLGQRIEANRTEIEKVRTDVEKVRTDLERGHKENRAWLLGAVLTIIGSIVGAGAYFGGDVPKVVHVPQYLPQYTQVLPGNILQELEEVRMLLLEMKREHEVEIESAPTD